MTEELEQQQLDAAFLWATLKEEKYITEYVGSNSDSLPIPGRGELLCYGKRLVGATCW